MKDGFIKVATATPQIKVANCEYNARKIVELIQNAANLRVKLLVLPELCITGYTCGDLFLQPTLLEAAILSLEKIVSETSTLDIVFAVGMPIVVDLKLYNAAVIVHKGNVLGVVPKKHIPNYSQFYEQRYFSQVERDNTTTIRLLGDDTVFGINQMFSCVNVPNFSFAVEICEDLWVPNPPSVSHALNGANIILNLSASDEGITKDDYRREIVKSQSARLVCAYIYSNAGFGESSTDMIFSGHNIIAENGKILKESVLFENGIQITEIDLSHLAFERRRMTTFKSQVQSGEYTTRSFLVDFCDTELTVVVRKTPFVPEKDGEVALRCEKIIRMQAEGIKKRLCHTGLKTLVVGVSGGLDSCLALFACVRTADLLKIDHKRIIAVTMPCFGTTNHTKENAKILCNELGVSFKEILISDAVNQHLKDISHDWQQHDSTYENAQARERTQVLMDIANQMNGIVIGTGDLTELALGWTTYNGDHMSMYGVNSSIPKTLVKHLVWHEANQASNVRLKETVYSIINTPISPELLPPDGDDISQCTEEIVGPYELHDFFLYYFVRKGFSPTKIKRLALYAFSDKYDDKSIAKWLKLFISRFFSQQFKRSCLPDGPKVGSVTLSPRGDFRMPSDASPDVWLKDI